MNKHKYKLTYKMKKRPEGILEKDLDKSQGSGACDAVLFCSLVYPEDGSFSCYFLGIDGRKPKNDDPLEDKEWFKVWTLLGSRLADSKTLPADKKALCRQVFEGVRAKVLGFSLN